VLRVTYARLDELRDDVARQLARGGLLVKIPDLSGLAHDTPVRLELVLPDGSLLSGAASVLQVLTGFGVAVSVGPELVEQVTRCAGRARGGDPRRHVPTRHERLDGEPTRPSPPPLLARATASTVPPPRVAHATASTLPPPRVARATGSTLPPRRAEPGVPSPTLTPPPRGAPTRPPHTTPAPPVAQPGPDARAMHRTAPPQLGARPAGAAPPDATARAAAPILSAPPTRAEKIQQALRGSRDERNAILRDRDRTLHPFVLKNPQLDADDVTAIAKNAQLAPDLLKMIGERKEWCTRLPIAQALARNPRTPPDVAVRALDHLPIDALRALAKGAGVLPHVAQAARRKLLG
jgi:hypothetical protein